MPAGTGVLFGLTGRTIAEGHLARAAMEGVALGLNYGLRRLNALGVRPKEIRLTGGGAKSRAWRQIMADVFAVPVVAMQQDEGAALGAALQAAWCVAGQGGRKASLSALAARVVALDPRTRCEPRKAQAARYRELQGLQDELSLALRPLFERHRRLVTR